MDTTEPFICKCSECLKLGPLYANINRKDSLSTQECEKVSDINKKQILNIGWILIILFLLVSSKFLKYNKYI